jgi:hypothetical protein
VQPHLRDGLLAVVVGSGCLAALVAIDALGSLGRPVPALVGVGGALAIETLFLTGTPAADLWERPAIQAAGVVATLGGGLAAAWLLGPWLLAAICWGIATFFAVLAAMLVLAHPGLSKG